MSKIIILQDVNAKQWNALVSHPLQSYEWGEFRKKTKTTILRLGEYEKDKLKQGYLVSIHKLPKLNYFIGYLPKSTQITENLIHFLHDYGKHHNIIFFQLEPHITQKQKNPLLTLGIKPSHHPLFTTFTFSLDLRLSEQTLLERMHPKTRYNIRVAQKHNVLVQEDNSPQAFEQYLKLSQETTERQKFFAHSELYHRTMWETLHPSGIAKLWTATYKEKTLAAWIIFLWKDTIYYPYGASSRNDRQVMAPNLLLWNIALWGKKMGYNNFDLWGALGPDPDKNDPWYGFHRFKQGYNPSLIQFIGSYDVIAIPYLYPLYCIADTIRWKILKKL